MTGDSARVSMAAVYGVSHFVIDLACIATMLGAVSRTLGIEGAEGVVAAIVAYDLLAFCLQLPFGALVDLADRNARAAMVACGLVAAGTFVSAAPHAPAALAAVALVAVGNALFHCAGGLDVLNVAQGKATLPGAFVSTGAAGVFLGGLMAVSHASLTPVLAALPIGCICAIASVDRMNRRIWNVRNKPFGLPRPSVRFIGACALLAITVALRSYAGMEMAFPWKADIAFAAGLVAGIVAGKAAGGVLADRRGLAAASIVSLAGSAALFPFAAAFPAIGMLAAFLFNFTMPVTLISLANLMPASRGIAFGVASFSLAIGALPALIGFDVDGPMALSVLAIASLACLLPALRLARGIQNEPDAQAATLQAEARA